MMLTTIPESMLSFPSEFLAGPGNLDIHDGLKKRELKDLGYRTRRNEQTTTAVTKQPTTPLCPSPHLSPSPPPTPSSLPTNA